MSEHKNVFLYLKYSLFRPLGSAARGGLQLNPTPATPLKMSTLLQDSSGYKT